MPRYKRTAEVAFEEPQPEQEQDETLQKLRSMVEFAALSEYIFLFGEVVLRKVDAELDIEDLEAECLKPVPSEKLVEIGLALLKLVSSHRGLTPDIFDEYTRRQYVAKAPQRNPFGNDLDEEPNAFHDFDVFTKIRVLHQLSIWTFGNTDRMRGLMPQDDDHLTWRMEPLGWDKDDRAYFVLDDNRLYRRADEPIPPPTPMVKAKKATPKKSKSRGTRSSKRRRIEDTPDLEEDEAEVEAEAEAPAQDDTVMSDGVQVKEQEEPGYGFTGKTWECIAITLDDYQNFLATIFRSRDPNEKQLRKQIEENVLPIMEQRAEALRQKQLKKMRELENLQKMATAKRSSRLADKAEKELQEREEREAEDKKHAELRMAHEEQERQRRIEEGHESRRLTREQRLKEREVKRILHEEELARLEQEAERAESQDATSESADAVKRISGRQLKTQREQHQKELEKLAEDEDKWYFDCAVCGMHGDNMDDGTHSIACDRCNVWQHSRCHGFTPKQSEREDFHFVCATCKRKEEDAKKPKIPALKLGRTTGASASPEAARQGNELSTAEKSKEPGLPAHIQMQLDAVYGPQQPRPSPGPFGQLTNGPSLAPHGQAQGPPGYHYPPISNFAPRPPQQPHQNSPYLANGRPPSAGYGAPSPPIASGYAQTPHYPQHQYQHGSAMASAGGHPPLGFYSHQPKGYYAPQHQPHYSHSPPQQAQYQSPPTAIQGQQHPEARRPSYQLQQPQGQPLNGPPSSGQPMNGSQSPVRARPLASPAQQAAQPAVSHTPRQSQSSPFNHSPSTSFPPPPGMHQQQSSPIKSSPPPYRPQPPSGQQPQLVFQTPQSLRPQHANGQQVDQTPQMRETPARSDGVAADGMSGPWPAGSKAVPEKHDASPAPPTTSQAVGEKTVVPPPRAALAPSPGQQIAGNLGSVPVKKAQEMNGVHEPPSQTHQMGSPNTIPAILNKQE